MSSNAHEALRVLVAAFEEHLAAVIARRGDEDATVDEAYDALADAFDRYEAVLDVELGETLPMIADDDEELDDEELDGHAEEDEDELDDDLDDFELS
ncbi:primosomal protein [Demequina lignilytica]|uniref:Primosomal protein n=1 Tax=Demequina lignilytica TaxID=3051663 RepID=A0AB35MKR7_9MICO|nr:primosomal protein [Demequina sp. SYSU T0a273]MDN4484348.1 primosomal protein [Demequina sp. SYSU T0a273]